MSCPKEPEHLCIYAANFVMVDANDQYPLCDTLLEIYDVIFWIQGSIK